jgi:hypothetical protein
MEAPPLDRSAGQGDVDRLADSQVVEEGGPKGLLPRLKRRFDSDLERVRLLTNLTPNLRRQGAEPSKDLGELSFPPEDADPDLFQRLSITRPVNGRQR